jgi:GT2 family glycosyltransferase
MKEFYTSICIITLNHLEISKRCLLSLLDTDFRGNMELILVDNGSTDGTADWLKEYQDKYSSDKIRIVLILNKENRGCTGGRNQACLLATGKYVVILDNDIEIFQRDWLKKMIQFYETQDKVGIVGPKLLFASRPELIQTAGVGVTKTGVVAYWGQGKNRNDPKFNYIREIQGYPGACWLICREIFNEVGYFDEVYHPVNYEDVDLCYRIRQKGYKVLYYPEVELYHHQHVTTKNTVGLSFARVTVKNGIIFKERWKHVFEQEDGMEMEDVNFEEDTLENIVKE